MRKLNNLLFVLLLTFIFSACNDNNKPVSPSEDLTLYIRDDAGEMIIPLMLNKSWKFKKTAGGEENPKPDKFIKNILVDNTIIDQKILPIREYDKGVGDGKYKYKALCYLTTNDLAYFYMENKLLYGSYLIVDAYGNESVTWEGELPTTFTETSSAYYTLDRSINILDPEIKREESLLYECPGYYTVDVELDGNDVKRYKDCKRFTYNNSSSSHSSGVRTNIFYFKQGIGLIKYQQYIKANPAAKDSALIYEQVINEQDFPGDVR